MTKGREGSLSIIYITCNSPSIHAKYILYIDLTMPPSGREGVILMGHQVQAPSPPPEWSPPIYPQLLSKNIN